MTFKSKKVEVVEIPAVVEDTEAVVEEQENPLVARKAFLLELLDTLDKNKFSSRGHVENELNIVIRDLEAGR